MYNIGRKKISRRQNETTTISKDMGVTVTVIVNNAMLGVY